MDIEYWEKIEIYETSCTCTWNLFRIILKTDVVVCLSVVAKSHLKNQFILLHKPMYKLYLVLHASNIFNVMIFH